MDKSQLLRLLPRNKEDVEGAEALVKLGYPTLEPVLPQMLDWLRTNGSPVDLVMREFFAQLGEPGVVVVRAAFHSKMELLHHTILTYVLPRWSPSAVAQVESELKMLVTAAGFYKTDLEAMHLLAKHDLAERQWLRGWLAFKVRRLREHLEQAEGIETELKGENAL